MFDILIISKNDLYPPNMVSPCALARCQAEGWLPTAQRPSCPSSSPKPALWYTSLLSQSASCKWWYSAWSLWQKEHKGLSTLRYTFFSKLGNFSSKTSHLRWQTRSRSLSCWAWQRIQSRSLSNGCSHRLCRWCWRQAAEDKKKTFYEVVWSIKIICIILVKIFLILLEMPHSKSKPYVQIQMCIVKV